jgi:hypothetical protein
MNYFIGKARWTSSRAAKSPIVGASAKQACRGRQEEVQAESARKRPMGLIVVTV